VKSRIGANRNWANNAAGGAARIILSGAKVVKNFPARVTKPGHSTH
jgi:hypothetical protein